MKQAIMGYITALINTQRGSTDKYTNPVIRESKNSFIRELNNLLDFVKGSQEKVSNTTIVLSGENCKGEIYKQVLEEVLSNLRSIDSPNPADSYIDESIEIIKKVMEETK